MTGSGRLAVFRTSDNGRHWTDVTPAAAAAAGASSDGLVRGLYAQGDQSAQLAVASGGGAGTLFHTSDGGATWTTATVGPYESWYFSLVSSQRGWVEASRGAAAGSEAVDILQTLDGGAHWEVKSRSRSLDAQDPGTKGALDSGCDKTGIGFVDDLTGFATGVCASPGYYFRSTHDAGRTWTAENLPRPPGITQADVDAGGWTTELLPPVFDGANGAGIVVSNLATSSSTATHHDYVYLTRDRGAHWSLADPPLRDATWARTVNASDWWAGNASTLAHTSDAGAHWKTMPNDGLDLEITTLDHDLQFATAATGWVLVTNAQAEPRLLGTEDGGRTWQSINLPTLP